MISTLDVQAEQLIEKAADQKYLTTQDIRSAAGYSDEEAYETLYMRMETLGITIIDSSDDEGSDEPVTDDSKTDFEEKYDTIDILKYYEHEMARYRIPTREEEIELGRRIKAGDKTAEAALIVANLRLSDHIARGYQGWNISLLDLIQVGNIGLINAVRKYDCDRGAFGGYAAWHIHKQIIRAIAKHENISRYKLRQVFRLRREKKNLTDELNREPTRQELAARMHMSIKQIEELLLITRVPVSIDQTVGEDHSTTLRELIPGRDTDNPEVWFFRQLQEKQDWEHLKEALAILSEKEKDIFTARCGSDGNGPVKKQSLKQLAVKYGCSEQRISQIYLRARAKLIRYLNSKRDD